MAPIPLGHEATSAPLPVVTATSDPLLFTPPRLTSSEPPTTLFSPTDFRIALSALVNNSCQSRASSRCLVRGDDGRRRDAVSLAPVAETKRGDVSSRLSRLLPIRAQRLSLSVQAWRGGPLSILWRRRGRSSSEVQ